MFRLKELRNDSGMSQREFGQKIGVAESTVSLYESGKHEPDYSTLIKIADYFRVSIDYLLDRNVTFQERITITLDEEEIISVYREIGKKLGKDAQQSAVNLLHEIVKIKK